MEPNFTNTIQNKTSFHLLRKKCPILHIDDYILYFCYSLICKYWAFFLHFSFSEHVCGVSETKKGDFIYFRKKATDAQQARRRSKIGTPSIHSHTDCAQNQESRDQTGSQQDFYRLLSHWLILMIMSSVLRTLNSTTVHGLQGESYFIPPNDTTASLQFVHRQARRLVMNETIEIEMCGLNEKRALWRKEDTTSA